MRKSVFFVLVTFLLYCENIVFGENNNARQQNIYIVKRGNTINVICDSTHSNQDSILKWNGSLVEVNKRNFSCNNTYPFLAGDSVVYYTEGTSTNDNAEETSTSRQADTKDRTNERPKDENGDTKEESSLWWLWLISGCVGGIFVWEKWCRKKIIGNKKSNSNNLYLYDGERKRLEEENENLKNQIKQIQNEKQSLEKEKNNIWEENVKLGEEIESLKNTIKSEPIPAQNIQTASLSKSGTLYAVSIIDGYLQRVKDTANEDTVFELSLKSASKADITVYKSAYEKILDNPSHLEGCDKQIVGRTSVNVEQAGEAERDDNGKWRVTKRVKVLVQ